MKRVVIIGGVACSLYFLLEYFTDEKMNKDLVIKILNKQEMKFMPLFSSCAVSFVNMKKEHPEFKDEQITAYLKSPKFEMMAFIDKVEEKIYTDVGVTQQQFQYACLNTYKNDEEVKKLMKDQQIDYLNALKGIRPKSLEKHIKKQQQLRLQKKQVQAKQIEEKLKDVEQLDVLTKEKTLEIMKQISEGCLIRITKRISDLAKIQSINPADLHKYLQNLKLTEIQQEVLKNHNIPNTETISNFDYYQKAIMLHAKNHKDFQIEVQEMQKQQQTAIKMLFLSPEKKQQLQGLNSLKTKLPLKEQKEFEKMAKMAGIQDKPKTTE